jgi:hypothetical protein
MEVGLHPSKDRTVLIRALTADRRPAIKQRGAEVE